MILAVAGALAGVVAHEAMRPRSQPLWLAPKGAHPAAIAPLPGGGPPSGGRGGPVTIVLGGDAMLGRQVDRRIASEPRYSPWAGLAGVLRGADVFAFNLECTITDADPWGPWKRFRLRLRPANADRALGAFPQDVAVVASVANNHVLDHGPEGLAETLAVLDGAGILHAGAGPDATAAWTPAVATTRSGARVGVLALGDHCGCLRMSAWVAGRDQPGIAYEDLSDGSWNRLLGAVRALDPAVDVSVVSLHAGPNWLPDGPTAWQRRLAAALVDAGADVVWMHSAHHLLPVEVIRGKHVFYGLGDLVNDYVKHPEYRSDLALVARMEIAADGTQALHPVPVRTRQRRIRVLGTGDPDRDEVLRRVGLD